MTTLLPPSLPPSGAVLSSKAQSDNQLKEVRKKARHVIHALHKAQQKLEAMQVGWNGLGQWQLLHILEAVAGVDSRVRCVGVAYAETRSGHSLFP